MKLFCTPGSCSLSPHIILREAGLDFTLENVDLAQKKTESGADYRAIAPKGQVPALLLDNGALLTEGVVIVQYLADQVPDRKLLPPAGSLSRYHAIAWLNFIATELHQQFAPLFSAATPAAYQAICRQKLAKQFRYLAAELKQQPFLLGNRFSVADAYLFTVLRWAKHVQLDLADYPPLAAYYQRIAARPAVDAALQAEGLL